MVSVGCGSVAMGASHGVVSLAFGTVVMLAILVFGPWSGAHINPAVSLAFWRDGQLESHLLPVYLGAQFLGGLFGAWVVAGAAPTGLDPTISLAEGFGIEVAITAALMASILWIVQRSPSRLTVAAWVGATVGILAFLAEPLTGCAYTTYLTNCLSSHRAEEVMALVEAAPYDVARRFKNLHHKLSHA